MKPNKATLILSLFFLFFAVTIQSSALEVSDLTGQDISQADYSKLLSAAKSKNPPKNGKNYVIGFANLQRDIPFCAKVEEGILKNAKTAGIEVLVTDNRLDGPTALANAESYIQRNADYIIEFQTDANFGRKIIEKTNQAGIKVIAIDIPMPGSTFFGANNPRSGFMGGVYLAQAANKKWGKNKVRRQAYFVIAELPQSGAIPAMRTGGQVAGFLSQVRNFSKDRIIKFDSKNTREESFTQMSNIMGRIPQDAPIVATGINDQTILGMVRALKRVGREKNAIFVGMGADETADMVKEDPFIASVGYFPERYGNYLVPLALKELAGEKLSPAILVNHVMVDQSNV